MRIGEVADCFGDERWFGQGKRQRVVNRVIVEENSFFFYFKIEF